MEKLAPVIGWIGLLFGVVTAICTPLPGWGQVVALGTMLLGFLFCSVYILLSSRYQLESKWFNPGYVGMFLSSAPLIMILYFMLTK
jgi:hypothetical protein